MLFSPTLSAPAQRELHQGIAALSLPPSQMPAEAPATEEPKKEEKVARQTKPRFSIMGF